jgi:hypothetical protein
MYSNPVQDLVKAYKPGLAEEQHMQTLLDEFINMHPHGIHGHYQPGHITGAAWIIDSTNQYTLLCNQNNTGAWLPVNTHLDDRTDIAHAVLEQAKAYTEIQKLSLISSSVFNIDIYKVNARASEPEHTHYELCFLMEAEMDLRWQLHHESKGLAWIGLDDVYFYNDSPAIMRMVEKTKQQQTHKFYNRV